MFGRDELPRLRGRALCYRVEAADDLDLTVPIYLRTRRAVIERSTTARRASLGVSSSLGGGSALRFNRNAVREPRPTTDEQELIPGLSGCNLPSEVVRLVVHGTSTGRRLARPISPDSPTEGLGRSDSVPAGHRDQAVGDTRFSRARKSSRPHSQAARAGEWKGCLAFFPAYTVEIDDHDDQTAGNDSLPERIDVHQVRAIGDGGQNEGTKQRSMHRTDGTEQTCAADN
jgi:hypothetical protein